MPIGAPSLLKLTGVATPKDVLLDGKDFSACLTGDAPSPRQQRCWLWINYQEPDQQTDR